MTKKKKSFSKDHLQIPGSLIEFSAEDGLQLHGLLCRKSRSKTCVIYVHGMGGNFYRHLLPRIISSSVTARGFGFFSMNTRGHDGVSSSFSARKKRKIVCGTNFEKFEDCVFDIKGAIVMLRRLGFRKFILCGHSTGCQKITFYQYKRKDKSVSGIILLAPGDDHNIQRISLGKRFSQVIALCRKMMNDGRGHETHRDIPGGFSARRYLSCADDKYVESRLFNYDGKLREFSKLTVPVLAVFGSKEQFADRPVEEYLDMLERKSHSRFFCKVNIQGGDHSFAGKEKEVARKIMQWLRRIN